MNIEQPDERLTWTTEVKTLIYRAGKAGGTVTRYPGGRWYPTGDTERRHFETTTIEALVRQGVLEYCVWQKFGSRRFPICARLKPVHHRSLGIGDNQNV